MTRRTAHYTRYANRPVRAVTSPPPARARGWRMIEVVRAAWGTALLIGPGPILKRMHRVQADSRSIAVARLLGGRHLVQAALSGFRPSPAVLALGVWVDTVHASTALAFAAGDRARARAAITDAAVAAGWAAAGFRDLTRSRAQRSASERRRDQLASSVLRHLPAAGPLLSASASDR